ncbi:hypothetical protein RB595_005193 [Gaeumannomyces hyphopodioides]
MEGVLSEIRPISSEQGLRSFEEKTVEQAVQKLLGAIFENTQLRDSLSLRGRVTFENYTYCIFRATDDVERAALAIEYKPPHKLSHNDVVKGLESEIELERDVINQNCENSVRLTAAVITQLFSYMIGIHVQYGYVCTGEAFIFLHIPDDPSTVFYHVCVPNLDVIPDKENKYHRTAVAQVLAFALEAARAEPPPQAWRDATKSLATWKQEYEEMPSESPESDRKRKRSSSSYDPESVPNIKRSPIRTRSRRKPPNPTPNPGEDEGDGEDHPPAPTPGPSTRSGNKPATSTRGGRGQGRRGGGRRPGNAAQPSTQERSGNATKISIKERPYCTHLCLLGLAHGGPIDEACPNAVSHGPKHIKPAKFLKLLRDQLAKDRGHDADIQPLYLCGAVGTLFKLRLSAYGYTVVAKGVEAPGLAVLRHEKEAYDQARTIQGKHIPVCLGLMHVILPLYSQGWVCEHILLLSWAGKSILSCADRIDKTFVTSAAITACTELHRLGILHCDAEPRNILYDGGIMIVDFERSELRRPPLGSIQNQGGKHKVSSRGKDEDFARELRGITRSLWECFRNF